VKVNRYAGGVRRSGVRGYVIAVAAVTGATLIKLLVNVMQQGSPFVWFFGTVMLVAWLGGRRAGLLAAVLAVSSAAVFFMAPYSSLAYLTRFPIDILKIDQTFVGNITEDPDAASIVSAIIGLAHNLRLQVIAEGAAQLDYLRREGCDEAQGFYFSRPLPAAEFVRLLETGGMFSRIEESSL
jgi:hypothetical protein